jgi:hypothetical protein
MNRWAFVLVVILTAACSDSPELSEQQQRELLAEAVVLLDKTKAQGTVNKGNWKEPIAALKPESVFVTNEGLYIKMGSSFGTEYGYFVPRPATVVNESSGTDPSYKKLGNGIYRYRIKG